MASFLRKGNRTCTQHSRWDLAAALYIGMGVSGLRQNKADFNINSSPLAFWAAATHESVHFEPQDDFHWVLRLVIPLHSCTVPVRLSVFRDNKWLSLAFRGKSYLSTHPRTTSIVAEVFSARWPYHLDIIGEEKTGWFQADARPILQSRNESGPVHRLLRNCARQV